MSSVTVTGANKRYGTLAALDDVSVKFADGEFFGLLGPSGSGKTTLLRSIAGFVDLDSGDIRIDSQDVRDIPVHRRDIGMVFQNYALFPHMTVFDNIAFGLSVRRARRDETARRVREMLGLVRLAGLEERKPRQLSGGQQQRVALARALITRPRVLLLDEPLGALDKRLRQQMQVELKQIQREIGITTIFVTHDQEEALTLSDRIAILNDGRIVQVGAPDAVYERPETAFAASFLGDANFFPGRVVGMVGGFGCIETAAHGSLVTADELPPTQTQVVLAVRPEKCIIEPADAPEGDDAPSTNRLVGRLAQTIYSGNSITYRVEAAGDVFTVFEQNRQARKFASGEAVRIAWSASHSVLVRP
jgi:spermidine/putrescine ABC transporter ATP-binding subunit